MREAVRKERRRAEQHNGARTPYIGLKHAAGPRTDTGNRNQSGVRKGGRNTRGPDDATRREENGEAGKADCCT